MVGRPLKIIEIKDDLSLHLNRKEFDKLENRLNDPSIRNLPISVISVVGCFRKGKSFLLGYLLRYLRNNGGETGMLTAAEAAISSWVDISAGAEWMGNASEKLDGFKWDHGCNGVTAGIQIWSEIFKIKLNGLETAVLLMDTQGLFDSQILFKECTTIFALSTMLSSIQIYNLSKDIDESDLQHLNLFADYGKQHIRLAENSNRKPFQKLQFLIRDWESITDYPVGSKGGLQYFESKFKIAETSPNEFRCVRETIISCFNEISCFLMPHPGKTVATGIHYDTRKIYRGELKDMDFEFKENLKSFIAEEVFMGLVPKKFGQREITSNQFCKYITTYLTKFEKSKIPSPKSVFEANTEAGYLIAIAEAYDRYIYLMDNMPDGTDFSNISLEQMKALHERFMGQALNHFDNWFGMGNNQMRGLYREVVEKKIMTKYHQIRAKADLASMKKHSKVVSNILEKLQSLKIYVDEYHRNVNIAKTSGFVLACVGTGCGIAGIFLAPVTGGLSLSWTIAAIGTSAAGAATNLTAGLMKQQKFKEISIKINQDLEKRNIFISKYIEKIGEMAIAKSGVFDSIIKNFAEMGFSEDKARETFSQTVNEYIKLLNDKEFRLQNKFGENEMVRLALCRVMNWAQDFVERFSTIIGQIVAWIRDILDEFIRDSPYLDILAIVALTSSTTFNFGNVIAQSLSFARLALDGVTEISEMALKIANIAAKIAPFIGVILTLLDLPFLIIDWANPPKLSTEIAKIIENLEKEKEILDRLSCGGIN